ncbi:dienelactone hydrolase family protein [Kitasatospora sp. NBC_01287]|uniref:dienelactone hydrolase family protein n=1 Tax=Kitasatospora sp. NBC_01287 TaxID=2903573 RepID=UPI00225BCEC8|nr:dienelactone hydrolase family protein [Kitasatospora sp. NBC_01287]MCX4747019.1 dienelactone hydrolase family protein [Kitasatospora sp. NBC_01287]
MANWEFLTEGGIEAYVVRPAEAVPVRGAVVLCTELYGINDYIRTVGDRLAATGYAVLVPDFYWRQQRRPQLSYSAADREAGLVLMRALDRDELIADAGTALDAARGLAEGRGVAFLGLSMGGHIALRAATALRFELAALFYPGWMLNSGMPMVGPVPPVEQAADIASNGAFVLGLVGDADHILPPAEWQEAERRLTAAGVRHELISYPGVKHGFAIEDRPADYDAQAAGAAWERVHAALAEHL